jgi:hypothetical protein
MSDIDDYLAAVSDRLHVPRAQRRRILDEVRDHLADATTDLEASGITVPDARRQAIAAFGPPGQLAREFNAQAATATMRRTPLVIGAGGAAVASGFVLAAATLPHPSSAAPAGISAQILFFVAIVAFQCAAVAGIRAASLVAARWQAAIAPPADRDVVRRAATICAAGLAVAAAAWLAAMSVRTGGGSLLREAGTVVGVLLIVVGALAAGSFAVRHRAEPADPEGSPIPAPSGVIAGSGERLVNLARAYPVITCIVTACVAAASAMSHADTPVLGAVPWALGEAAAVVAAFVLLGPSLGLRDGQAGAIADT